MRRLIFGGIGTALLVGLYVVSWGYYVANGSQPDCANGAMLCSSVPQQARTPGIWNPLPYFDTVRQDGQLGNIQPLHSFLAAARKGTLPNLRPRTATNCRRTGLRTPSPRLVISPYAKKGYIDHQTLSQDAYLKFIEDDFLHGARIDPHTDGRPDPRPDVRENAKILGNLADDFDFDQRPRRPLILAPHARFS